jgi:hypothetical protein
MNNSLNNNIYTFTDNLPNYKVELNSFGYITPEFKFNTGLCVGACDIAGYRLSKEEKYWWEYFIGWDALGTPGAKTDWLLDKLQSYVNTYNPHTILFVFPRLTPQGKINFSDKFLPLSFNNEKLIKILYASKRLTKTQTKQLLEWCKTFNLKNVVDTERYSDVIYKLKMTVGDRKFFWTINPTDSIQDYWQLLLPKILQDNFFKTSFVEPPSLVDEHLDGSIGMMTSLKLAETFKQVL